ncbi:MAG TPA: CU044_5270 family protein [Streptosporangiaceae bacterium]
MNANRRRGSDQRLIAELAELLPVPAQRDLPAGRQEAIKEHLMTELRQADHSEVHRERAGSRRRLAALTATAAAAAVAAAGLTLTALSGHHSPRSAGHHHQAGHVTAAQLLDEIAAAAARQPRLNVRDDQYMYIASEDRWSSTSMTIGGSQRTVVEPLHKREIWLSVSDVCKPGLLRDPSPGLAMKLNGGGLSCPNQGGWGDPTYRFLQSLPTDPHTLLNMIYAATKGQGQSPDQEAFTTIGDMLREAIAPPDVGAALYRAAALIPGVRVIPHATDILGQSGIGVQFARRVIQSPAPGVPYRETFDPNGLTWIFNPSTLLWMGESDGTVHGKLTGSVVLKRAIVDRLGQLPGGE